MRNKREEILNDLFKIATEIKETGSYDSMIKSQVKDVKETIEWLEELYDSPRLTSGEKSLIHWSIKRIDSLIRSLHR